MIERISELEVGTVDDGVAETAVVNDEEDEVVSVQLELEVKLWEVAVGTEDTDEAVDALSGDTLVVKLIEELSISDELLPCCFVLSLAVKDSDDVKTIEVELSGGTEVVDRTTLL